MCRCFYLLQWSCVEPLILPYFFDYYQLFYGLAYKISPLSSKGTKCQKSHRASEWKLATRRIFFFQMTPVVSWTPSTKLLEPLNSQPLVGRQQRPSMTELTGPTALGAVTNRRCVLMHSGPTAISHYITNLGGLILCTQKMSTVKICRAYQKFWGAQDMQIRIFTVFNLASDHS